MPARGGAKAPPPGAAARGCHGARRDREQLRDLGHRQLLQLGEYEDRSQLGRQLVEQPVQAAPQLLVPQLPLGGRPRIRVAQRRLFVRDLPRPPRLAPHVGRHAQRRAEQEGPLGAILHVLRPPGEDQQHLLHRVLHLLLRDPHPAHEAPERVVVSRHDCTNAPIDVVDGAAESREGRGDGHGSGTCS